MAHMIYGNKEIRGITVHDIETILAQFADDTGAYLEYSPLCINAFLNTLACVEEQMGLKVSYDKTVLYQMGSLANSNARIITCKMVQWSNEPIESLGIFIGCKGEDVPQNFDKIMRKMDATCASWFNRTLTLIGKVLVINVLMGSLFVYSLFTMLSPSENQVKLVR